MIEFPISKFGLSFRLVEESDAEFILSLRTDSKLSRFVSPVENNLSKQINWIRNYKLREKDRKEYYFIFQDNKNIPIGVIRIYNIVDDTFESGSWLVIKGIKDFSSMKADLFVMWFAFDLLKLSYCVFETRKNNLNVVNYHKKFATQVNEDKLNYYFKMDYNQYQIKKNFLQKTLNLND